MYLLDTNVVSELRRAGDGRADANVAAWLNRVDASTHFISVITLFELEIGTLRLERRDPRQGALLRAWLRDQVIPEFVNRVLPIDAAVALRCASLHIPKTQSDNDAFIAATALVHGLTVVTRNVADFEGTGVTMLNPWAQQ